VKVMSTPRNLENTLQQKEGVYFSKEGEDFKAARTAVGGEWEDFIVEVHGFNSGSVEWMVTGGNVSLICGGRISGGYRFCTENTDVCTVKTHLDGKAELKPEWMYIKRTDTWSRRKTMSLAWGVTHYIFCGRVEELGITMLKAVEFNRFCEILLVQVDDGASAHEVDSPPIADTVMRPLECRTPCKVKFMKLSLNPWKIWVGQMSCHEERPRWTNTRIRRSTTPFGLTKWP
jgi:hypothetical protein